MRILRGTERALRTDAEFCQDLMPDPYFLFLCHCRVESKRGRIRRMNFWETIAEDLSQAGFCWGSVSAIDSNGQTICA
jgi:hypothetical protein